MGNGPDLTQHAFDEVLPDKKHRLDSAHNARMVFEHQIMMLEIAVQRLIDDLVVTMILALIPKSERPCVTILEIGE